jgi:hypothetical protein
VANLHECRGGQRYKFATRGLEESGDVNFTADFLSGVSGVYSQINTSSPALKDIQNFLNMTPQSYVHIA